MTTFKIHPAATWLPQLSEVEFGEIKRPAHRPNTGGRTVEKAAKIMRVSASSVKRAQRRLKPKKHKPQIDRTSRKFVMARLQRFLDFWKITEHRAVRKICAEFFAE